MDLDPIYIIRDAGFGRDFNPKLWSAVAAIALVLWDWRTQKRLDYLWVFLTGTLLWAGAEAFLAVQGIRDMPERLLFGRPLSLPTSYVLQGMAEGALVAVAGLFVGDRILCRSRRTRGLVLGAVGLLAVAAATFRSRRFLMPEAPASRRDILDTKALVALFVMSLIAILFYVLAKQWRPRTLAMFLYMLVFGAVWAICQVAIGGRWVEVTAPGGAYERASPAVSLFALTWDVVIEIALIYVVFLAIPVVLRLMRDPTPLPTCADEGDRSGEQRDVAAV